MNKMHAEFFQEISLFQVFSPKLYVFLFSLMEAARSYKTYKCILRQNLELLSDKLVFNKELLTLKVLM